MQEPQALLRERDRQRPAAIDGYQRRQGEFPRVRFDLTGRLRTLCLRGARNGSDGRIRLVPNAAMLTDVTGKLGNRRRLEKRPQRYLDIEGLSDPRYGLGREKRVAAELKEIVQDSDALDPEHF